MEKRSNWRKYYIYPQCFTTCSNIMFEESACQKSDCLLNKILYNSLTKIDHAKTSDFFTQRNKNSSREPHNYPINLFFSVHKNLVYFWRAIFFSWCQPQYFMKDEILKISCKKRHSFLNGSYTFDKNSPSKWNFRSFEWLRENSQNFSCHIWNY